MATTTMALSLTEEQGMLLDSARAFCTDNSAIVYDSEAAA